MISGEISVTILAFILDYFQENQMRKFFKTSKKLCFGVILSNFCPNLKKNEFSWKKGLCQFLNNPIIFHGAKNLKKITTHPLKKCQTADGQTENSDFIRPSVGQGSKKSNLEQDATFFERGK